VSPDPNRPKGNANCWFDRQYGEYVMTAGDKDIIAYNQITRSGNPHCNCASACFLIWASGITREGNVVGIHRPYYDEGYFGKLSANEAQEKYAIMLADYKSYLAKLDVPTAIIDRMFATDSRSMHYLDKGELELMTSTPFLEELTQAKCGTAQHRREYNRNGTWKSTTFDAKHIECYRGILKELTKSGAQRYLDHEKEPTVLQR
jgi:hypothetical protein